MLLPTPRDFSGVNIDEVDSDELVSSEIQSKNDCCGVGANRVWRLDRADCFLRQLFRGLSSNALGNGAGT